MFLHVMPCPLCSTMALQQAQMLLSMNSLESVNAGVQQNNTESFAVALCHLAELHAEQVMCLELGKLGHLLDWSAWTQELGKDL